MKLKIIPWIFVLLPLLFPCCSEDLSPTLLFPDGSSARLLEIRKNHARYLVFHYDAAARVERIVQYHSETDSQAVVITYDAANRMVSRTTNWSCDSVFYDRYGRLHSMTTTFPKSEARHTTLFSVTNGRIRSARVFSGDKEFNRIEYSYDRRGNTLSRKCIISEYRFSYDDKPRPFKDLAGLPPDIVQYNNPVSYYYHNAIMSSFPPEYEISYQYGADGLPLTETRTDKRIQQTTTYNYIYSQGN